MAIPEIRRWTREDSERMAEQGCFRPDERGELADGALFETAPPNRWRASAIQAAQEALGPAFRRGYSLRIQMPLALGPGSEPEPDLAVVRGQWRDFREAPPTTATLVLEIADSTDVHDRDRQSAIYALAGVPEYWILNRLESCLEVQRDPRDGAYQTRRILRAGETISPLARPEISIPIAELLP